MRDDQRRSVMEIMNGIKGVNLHEKKGGKFYFYLQPTKEMREAGIEALDLSQRSYNSLKRAGFQSVGEVAEAVASGRELRNIRNCGAKSVREIMEHLFLYQYQSLPVEKRSGYLLEVVAMNLERNGEYAAAER